MMHNDIVVEREFPLNIASLRLSCKLLFHNGYSTKMSMEKYELHSGRGTKLAKNLRICFCQNSIKMHYFRTKASFLAPPHGEGDKGTGKGIPLRQWGWGLVNAYEVKAGVVCLQCKSCLSTSEVMHFT